MTYIERRERPNIIEVQPGWPIQLPSQFTTLRPHQTQAIIEIVNKFNDGYRHVFLDAPTGAGKTIIGEAVRQLRCGGLGRGIYLCTTKTLQDQFLHDFPDANLIKGRSNYPTFDEPTRFLESGVRHLDATDCTYGRIPQRKIPACPTCDHYDPDEDFDPSAADDPTVGHCRHCHPYQSCPYRQAKEAALKGPLTVANTAYFLAESNFVGRLGLKFFDGKPVGPHFKFTVLDEADTLEQQLMSFVGLEITGRMLRRTGLNPPRYVTKPESWIEWTVYAEEHLKNLLVTMKAEYQLKTSDRRLREEIEDIERYKRRTSVVRERIAADPDNWVYDGQKGSAIKLRCVQVGPYGNEAFWRHTDETLLMSATLVSSDQMAEDVGIEPGTYTTVTVDSQFPVERRRIHVMPKASMTNKTKDTDWPKMADAIAEVAALHPVDRILVHTVSYKLTEYLQAELQARLDRPIMYYLKASQRESALADFRTAHAAIMLAPSFDRGVDLPDDDVRVIVIAKVPFPYLGDKQVNKRLYGTGRSGQSWYATQTVRSLVQMTGRGMRHKDDWCTSYILDAQFNSNVWRNNRHLIPDWWKNALHWPPVGR